MNLEKLTHEPSPCAVRVAIAGSFFDPPIQFGDSGADCPVAVIEDGYGEHQRVTIGTLGTIVAQAAQRRVRNPAVIVVGDVVTLSPYAPEELSARKAEAL